ncbi:MAG: HAD hydrolase family protein [Phycisphaeraceae bacterium]|nr:HAD hydrolase family protein [Phycisphaeraceae bacterium]
MKKNKSIDFEAINWLVLDVDGVLTDGTIMLRGDGSESKRFNLHDGHGIKLWMRAGGDVALLSGRASMATQCRAEQLNIKHVFQDCHQKLPVLKEFLDRMQIDSERVAYVGDDLLDIPGVRHAGFGVAVANAVQELKDRADHITTAGGGEGAVREVVEYILKRAGKWDALMERYLVT